MAFSAIGARTQAAGSRAGGAGPGRSPAPAPVCDRWAADGPRLRDVRLWVYKRHRRIMARAKLGPVAIDADGRAVGSPAVSFAGRTGGGDGRYRRCAAETQYVASARPASPRRSLGTVRAGRPDDPDTAA